jgi:arginine decarboxylase
MPDGASGSRYADVVQDLWADSAIWDYARYDREGDLWIGKLRVKDALRAYGSPLEIVDTTIVSRRCREWQALTEGIAADIGYSGHLDYLYAAKANMASEVAHAAYRSGWGAETSSRQDLDHLRWMHDHGLLPQGLRVVCNGFKLPPETYSWQRAGGTPPLGEGELAGAGAASASDLDAEVKPGAIRFPRDTVSQNVRDVTYAEAILAAARDGWDICPILDEGELETFARPDAPRMNVGLRMKHGPVASFAELEHLVSRFGMDQPTLRETAQRVAAADNLTLQTLHAMVGAATTIPVDVFVRALLLAGQVWCDLRTEHPTLRELNIGGGVPPLSEPYDHRTFVRGLLSGLMRLSKERGVPAPDVTFELGSLVSAECGFHAFRVLQFKRNHEGGDGHRVASGGTLGRDLAGDSAGGQPAGGVDRWAIVDGGLMAAIPDMLILGKSFRILAAEGGNAACESVRLGDLTCDSDGRYPPKAFGDDASVLLPAVEGPHHVVIFGVGAYQEILSGVRGAHHCGLLEAIELIIEPGADGQLQARLMPRQTSSEAASLLGYTDDAVKPLRAALEFSDASR